MSRRDPAAVVAGLLRALTQPKKRRIAMPLTPEQEARRAAEIERQRWNDEVEARKLEKKAKKK